MATRIQQRRGTAAQWESLNPVLADGEIGFERDTRLFKVGDGTTAWASLLAPFVSLAGGSTILASGAAIKPLTLKAASGQSANMLEVQDTAAAVIASITSGGGLYGSAAVGNAGYFQSRAPGALPLLVKGASGQTANFAEFHDWGGAVKASILANGSMTMQTATIAGGLNVTAGDATITQRSRLTGSGDYGASLNILAGNYGGVGAVGLVIRGSAGQTGDLLQAQNSAGTGLTSIQSTGTIFTTAGVQSKSQIPAGSTVASSYPQGMSTNYVVTGDGWPGRGVVITWRFENTAAMQFLMCDDRVDTFVRNAPNQSLSSAWGAWRTL